MFRAKITASDGYASPPKDFGSLSSAIAWIKGDGLAEFEGETVRGEIVDLNDGKVAWVRSNLESKEGVAREAKLDAHRFLAGLNLTDKMGQR